MPEPIPPSLIQRLQRAGQFPRGAVVRGEAVRAKLSLSLHDRDPHAVEPNEMYRDIFKAYVPTPFQEGRYFPAGFQQLRNAGGATVYRYLWAEAIVKDLFSRFDRANLLNPTVARKYKETVLAPGTSKPGAELVQDSRPTVQCERLGEMAQRGPAWKRLRALVTRPSAASRA